MLAVGSLSAYRLDEGVSGYIADPVGGDGFEGRSYDAADYRHGLSEVDRALLAKLGQKAESYRAIDGDQCLPCDALDRTDGQLLADFYPDLAQNLLCSVSCQTCVHERFHAVVADIVTTHDGYGGDHPNLYEKHGAEVYGTDTGSVIRPPNPVTNPLVAAFVFCQRISELTCSKGLASRFW